MADPTLTPYTDNYTGQKNSTSSPFTLNGQKYNTEVATQVKDGIVQSQSQISLKKEVTDRSGKSYREYAVTRDGGKTWVTPGTSRDGGGQPITTANTGLTAAEIKGLKPGGNLNKAVLNASSISLKKQGASPAQVSAATTGKPQATEPTGDFNPTQFLGEIKNDKRTRNNFNNTSRPLIYPNDLGSTKQDIIQFDMLKYEPKNFSRENFGFSERSENRTSIGKVILPIPSGISDVSSVQWGGEPLNAAEAELANIALRTIPQGGEGFVSSIEEAAKKVTENSGAVKTAAAAAFAQQAAGVRGLLTRTTGLIINPNLELLFQAPTLRPFSFTFKMSARNKEEAQTIINIIRFFRQGMAPQRSGSNLFLKSPHTFKIRYKHRGETGEEHKYIGKIKECALQSFNVNYTPEGQYATFYDGVLVSYEMSMSFTELEPVFNEDNDQGYGEIGF